MVQSGQAMPQQMMMAGQMPHMMAGGSQMGAGPSAMPAANPYAAHYVPVVPTGGSAKARERIDRSPSGWTPIGKKMGLRCFNLKNLRTRCEPHCVVAACPCACMIALHVSTLTFCEHFIPHGAVLRCSAGRHGNWRKLLAHTLQKAALAHHQTHRTKVGTSSPQRVNPRCQCDHGVQEAVSGAAARADAGGAPV